MLTMRPSAPAGSSLAKAWLSWNGAVRLMDRWRCQSSSVVSARESGSKMAALLTSA
jgi:hypothetical protein